MTGNADNLLAKAIAIAFVLSVWFVPVVSGLQAAQCCPLSQAGGVPDCCAVNCAVDCGCCSLGEELPGPDNNDDRDQPGLPVPCGDGCDCLCCGTMAINLPIIAPANTGHFPRLEHAPSHALRSDVSPDSLALGVAVQPPIA